MGTWLAQFWSGFAGDFLDLPDGTQAGQLVARVVVAAVLGAALGYEREKKGKAAGLKTHTLVAVAAAFFVLVPQQLGVTPAELAPVVEGLAAGVGFLGAGTIIKRNDESVVEGLTSAAGIYLTTAVGIAAGFGRELTAIVGTGLALAVLTLTPRLLAWAEKRLGHAPAPKSSALILPGDPPSADKEAG